jgi:prepilin-type N-terminal cleavage/methylation domain-containing protein
MHQHRPVQSRGFTLIELLITITVIGIIVAMAAGALMNAQDTAREQRTRSLIAKLHSQMMYRWESYQTRRLPIASATLLNESPKVFAYRRLMSQRELMRLELPERWSDITDPANKGEPVIRNFLPFNPGNRYENLPALSEAYLRRYNDVVAKGHSISAENETAECLYLVLTMGHDDSLGGSQFRASDIADTDNDGMMEFVDGWRRPIRFLRWAPGYLPKPPYAWQSTPDTLPPGVADANSLAFTDMQTGNWADDHDPFDPLRIDAVTSTDSWRGYRLTPLIYSSGADGKPDIVGALKDVTFDYSVTTPQPNDPYAKATGGSDGAPLERMMGTPFDDDQDGSIDHMDNITNHALGVR